MRSLLAWAVGRWPHFWRLDLPTYATLVLDQLVVCLRRRSHPSLPRLVVPQLHVHAVELDAAIVEVAERYFGFQRSARCDVTVGDGLEYIRSLAARVEASPSAGAGVGAGAGTAPQPPAPPAADSAAAGAAPPAPPAAPPAAMPLTAADAASPVAAAQRQHLIIFDVDSKDVATGMTFPSKVRRVLSNHATRVWQPFRAALQPACLLPSVTHVCPPPPHSGVPGARCAASVQVSAHPRWHAGHQLRLPLRTAA